MKNFLTLLVFLSAFALGVQAQSTNDNSREARAIGAVRQARNYNGPLNAETESANVCFASGYVSTVLITVQLNCQQVNCDAVRIAPLARVEFGCDGEVTNVVFLR